MATATTPKSVNISPAVARVGRTVALHLQAGRYGVAAHVLAVAIEEQRRPARPEPIGPDTALAELPLTQQTIDRLEAADLLTIGDVDRLTDEDLAKLPRIGRTRIGEIRCKIGSARRRRRAT